MGKFVGVQRLFALLVLLSVALGAPLWGTTLDNMSTTGGFFNSTVVEYLGNNVSMDNPAGYLRPIATANGNNTVSLADLDVHSDTSEEILDWTLPDGNSNPFMDVTENRFLTLNLTSVEADRSYDVNLLFFGSGSTDPTFLTETQWLVNADATDLSPSVDVDTLAPVGAGQYFVRFRLLPSNLSGDVVTLSSIETSADSVPEPATLWLGIAGALLVAFRLRRRGQASS